MKNLKYIIGILFLNFFVLSSCQDDDIEVGELTAPTNVQIFETYLDKVDGIEQETAEPGLGSGKVRISATADNAMSIHIIVEGQTKLQRSGSVTHIFSTLGKNSYTVTAIAFGKGGLSTSTSKTIVVESLYAPPADLLQMLYGDGTTPKSWRIKNEAQNHFGLGPAGGTNPFEYYGAAPNDKAHVGMYDDRYIFSPDGTFTHIVDSTNDNPDIDPTGTVFGREVLINELDVNGGSGGEAEGADIINYNYTDYNTTWSLSAPEDVETISLGGLGFIGYYVGGDHQYRILNRSENEMIIEITDGNNQFDWGFTLIAD